MFKGTGIDENLVIAFSDTSQAQKAVRQWEFSHVPGKVKKKVQKILWGKGSASSGNFPGWGKK
jgi:hypothetical protein